MFDAIENRKRPRDCDSARSVFDFIGVPLHGVLMAYVSAEICNVVWSMNA